MRIRFGTWIHECKMVSNPGGDSKILNALTDNGMYTIVFDTNEEAAEAYIQILREGWFDATKFEYSN